MHAEVSIEKPKITKVKGNRKYYLIMEGFCELHNEIYVSYMSTIMHLFITIGNL